MPRKEAGICFWRLTMTTKTATRLYLAQFHQGWKMFHEFSDDFQHYDIVRLQRPDHYDLSPELAIYLWVRFLQTGSPLSYTLPSPEFQLLSNPEWYWQMPCYLFPLGGTVEERQYGFHSDPYYFQRLSHQPRWLPSPNQLLTA
jgi:hypothetical protein